MRPLHFLRRTRRGGNAMLELALAVPTLVLILAGATDFGRLLNETMVLQGASHRGALYASMNPDATDDAITNVTTADLDGRTGVTVQVTRTCSCGNSTVACNATSCASGGGAPSTAIRVTASKTLNTIIAYPGIPTPLGVAQATTMRSK